MTDLFMVVHEEFKSEKRNLITPMGKQSFQLFRDATFFLEEMRHCFLVNKKKRASFLTDWFSVFQV